MVRKLWKIELRGSKNHEKTWKMSSGTAKVSSGTALGTNRSRSGPKSHNVGLEGCQKGPFWRSFWEPFLRKVDLFRHRFSHQISEGILRGFLWILELIFMTFGLQNRAWIRKGENMKNLVFLKENLCFWRSRALLFGRKIYEKRCRNAMRNRNRLFHVFWWILTSILRSKMVKNQ